MKNNLDINSKLLISNRAHIILPTHKMIDASSEASKGKKKIGSTLKGIGPTYMDKTGRNGIRIGDLKSDNWTDKYNALRDKHLTILSNFKTKVDLDIDKLEDNFMTQSKFSTLVEHTVQESNGLINYIEAVATVCDEYDIEVEVVNKLISKPVSYTHLTLPTKRIV